MFLHLGCLSEAMFFLAKCGFWVLIWNALPSGGHESVPNCDVHQRVRESYQCRECRSFFRAHQVRRANAVSILCLGGHRIVPEFFFQETENTCLVGKCETIWLQLTSKHLKSRLRLPTHPFEDQFTGQSCQKSPRLLS